MAEVSRACCSKEAECRQLQDRSQEQQQKLLEAEAAAEQQTRELSAMQVRTGADVLEVTRHDGTPWASIGGGLAALCSSGTVWQLAVRAPLHQRMMNNCTCFAVLQADLTSAQQQLSDLQAQCEALTAEKSTLQQQTTETTAAGTKLREQLQHAQAEAARLQTDADSSAREASSLRMQLSQQVSAMQELQKAASGSGKELQVRLHTPGVALGWLHCLCRLCLCLRLLPPCQVCIH